MISFWERQNERCFAILGKFHDPFTVANYVLPIFQCLCRQAGFEEKLSYPNQVKPLGYCWKDKWPRKKESLENHLFRRTEGNLETKENKDCIYMDIFVVIIELPGFAESFSIKEGSWDKKIEIAIGVAKTLVAMQSSEKQNIYRDLKPSSILLKEVIIHFDPCLYFLCSF